MRATPTVILPVVALGSLALYDLHTQQDVTQGVKATSTIWEYESFCKFDDPPNWPPTQVRELKTMTPILLSSEKCAVLDEFLGHPKAILVSVANTSDSDGEMTLTLESVTLQRPNGVTMGPIAYRCVTMAMKLGQGRVRASGLKPDNTIMPTSSGQETVSCWSTILKGTWGMTLPPSGSADFVFLFTDADPGDAIRIEGLGAIVIQ